MPTPYYTRRDGPSDFEDSYWTNKVDPDGNERDLTQELERKREDVQEEVAFINGLAPGKVLDYGCGLGYLLHYLDSEKHDLYGYDISEYAVEWARALLAGDALAVDRFAVIAALAPFDVLIAYHVIEHVPSPKSFMDGLHDLLRTGGHLVISTPDFDSPCAQHFGINYRMLADPTHVNLFSRTGLHNMLVDYGFDVERVSTPYFKTRHFTRENLLRMLDTEKVSPPFPGNIMTFYARKVGE